METGSSSNDSVSARYLKGWRVIHLGGRREDHCCPELVESCYRYGNTLPKLSDAVKSLIPSEHNVAQPMCAIETLRNWPAFQLMDLEIRVV